MNFLKFKYKAAYNLSQVKLVQFLSLCLVFLEPSVWFIFPDIILFYYIILNPKSILKSWFVFLLISTLGSIFYWYICSFFHQESLKLLELTPGVTTQMLNFVSQSAESSNFLILLKQSFSGIPVKVWTWYYANSNLNLLSFMVPIIISRGFRLGVTAILARLFVYLAKPKIQKHFLWFLIISFSLFLFGFLLTLRNFAG